MTVKPFIALRPKPEDAAEVAAVPYDVCSAEEARELAKGRPKSFLHVSRPEIDLPDGASFSSEEAYARARQALDKLISDGTLARDDRPKFYVYRQKMGGHTQTGVVATFDTKDYLAGKIVRHEFTRPDKEDDRKRHIEVLGAHTGPGFLTYPDDPEIDALVDEICRTEPLYDFVASDGIGHTIWEVAETEALSAAFSKIPKMYIADGHHRTAAAARYAEDHNFEGESRYYMAVAFPANQLKILPYNRLVHDLNGLSDEEFLATVKRVFTGGQRSARMYFRGKWTTLSWDASSLNSVVDALDCSFLQNEFLRPVLGIDDPRTSERISFVGGIRGEAELQQRVDAGRAAVAFSMNPVTIHEVMAIADAGEVMPPKSTWFEPKLRSGLFIHKV